GGAEATGGAKIVSTDPADPEARIGVVASGSRDDADRAVEAGMGAWQTWREVPPPERAEYLFRAAAHIRDRRFLYAALQVREVGKGWREADADVCEAVDFLNYYGAEIIRLGSVRRLARYPGELNHYHYRPRGVGVVISPWNFPLAIATGMTAAGLAAGNCVIFKPSSNSPVTGAWMVEAFRAVGLPSGVLQFLPGPGDEVGHHLVAHRGIDFVAFTGSREVGLDIVRRAGDTQAGQRNVKQVIAEMGGKNAIIVDDSADLDEAVRGVTASAFGFQGQKCSACSRVIVLEAVKETFLERLVEAARSLRIGPPRDPVNQMGPVIDAGAVRKVRDYIEIGKGEGAILFEGDVPSAGFFVPPVIFAGIGPAHRLFREEIFGPVLSVVESGDLDEALALANDSEYALTGGIFSRSPANIEKARAGFHVGNLYINRGITGALVGRQPFGGAGMSGVGSKAGGPDYLLQFMVPRAICENTLRRGFAPPEEKG
ncbi:MAG: L-glutamate gamma-semialdehyde dehydrogenase, partial [bacterium]|nr:L-glutamate gamma-semialdehyde dehydrogenase [bacterium]